MKTIEEKNRMIAEFMGLKFKDDDAYIKELKEMKSNGIYFEQGYMTSELKYHTSWDWLMPVAEQIESIHEESNGVKYFLYDIDITQHSCRIDSIGIHMGGFNSKIEATYAAVLAFIEWYNENK
jgi:hypothetical protein